MRHSRVSTALAVVGVSLLVSTVVVGQVATPALNSKSPMRMYDAEGKAKGIQPNGRTEIRGKIKSVGYYTTNSPGTYSVTWDNGQNMQAIDGLGLKKEQADIIKAAFERDYVVTYWFDGNTGVFGVDVTKN